MLQAATGMILFSVLIPAKMWVAPEQPMLISVQAAGEVRMILTDFTGKILETKYPTTVAGGTRFDLRGMYPTFMGAAGTYILYAVPAGENKTPADCLGTPLVITVRRNNSPSAPPNPMVAKIEPLRYAQISTDAGDMTAVFFYDAAPSTVSAIQGFAEQGFYDGLTFHRIVPGFVIQGGDPTGTGTGGPGFHLEAEFNDRLHEEGTLSMARNGDPLEPQGVMPRCEYANSAGSQFFVCLARTEHLDRRYTAFGKVVEGLDVVKKLGATPLANVARGTPQKPPVINKFQIMPVTAQNNPYISVMINLRMTLEAARKAATRPTVLPPVPPAVPIKPLPDTTTPDEGPAKPPEKPAPGTGKKKPVVAQ